MSACDYVTVICIFSSEHTNLVCSVLSHLGYCHWMINFLSSSLQSDRGEGTQGILDWNQIEINHILTDQQKKLALKLGTELAFRWKYFD